MYPVVFVAESIINEWDCGPFNGTIKREPERKAGWCNLRQEIVDHRPEHWCVTIGGINGAWRSVLLPLKRGRTMAKAVADACAMFTAPDDIQIVNGIYGGCISLM